ncbi:MAG: SRPBCC family protein [Sporichthyaceae bacterium]
MAEFTGSRYADGPTVEVETYVEAPPERVWEFVSDIGLPPRVSGEVQRTEWADGSSGPAVGAQFHGWNKHEAIGEWQTTSTVVACEPGRIFGWAVGNVDLPAASWRFTLEPCGTGTTVRQWAQLGPGWSGLSRAIEQWPDKEEKIVRSRLTAHGEAMVRNLDEIKKLAESF